VFCSLSGDEFCKGMDEGEINPDEEFKARARKLADDYKWDVSDARKIWSFGCPPDCRANVVVDMIKGVSYLNEIKGSVVGAFLQATSAGVFCEENLRDIRVNLLDVTPRANANHCGAGQVRSLLRPALELTLCCSVLSPFCPALCCAVLRCSGHFCSALSCSVPIPFCSGVTCSDLSFSGLTRCVLLRPL
jgi:translation elongation factor EF-G